MSSFEKQNPLPAETQTDIVIGRQPVVGKAIKDTDKKVPRITPKEAPDPELVELLKNFKKKYGGVTGYRNLSESERYKRRAAFAEIRQKIRQQREGIATILRDIRATVDKNPTILFEELRASVMQTADQLGITEQQKQKIDEGLTKFAERNERVKKCRKEYPRKEDLFKAAFGFQPTGNIDLVWGPISFCFRCHNAEDYIAAYRAVAPYFNPEREAAIMHRSGGLALAKVKAPKLNDLVTLEKAQIDWAPAEPMITVPRPVEYLAPIKQGEQLLFTNEAGKRSMVNIRMLDKSNFYISQLPSGITIYQRVSDEDQSSDVFKARTVATAGREVRFESLLEKSGATYGSLRYTLAGEGKKRLSVLLDSRGVHLVNSSPKPLGQIVEMRLENKLVPPERSQRIIEHEEQHQFNKLFMPLEEERDYLTILQQAAQASGSPEKIVERIIRALAIKTRQEFTVDASARDEILAFYREGRPISEIRTILKDSPLYDYQNLLRDAIHEQIAAIRKKIENCFALVTSSLIATEEGKSETRVRKLSVLPVTDTAVERGLNFAFGPLYKEQIDEWLSAIEILEKKGYTSEIILGLLTQQPLKRWKRLADQLAYPTKSDRRYNL